MTDEERAAKLYIASTFQYLIAQKDPGILFAGTDPLSIRNELNDGEPERYLRAYEADEQKQRHPAESAAAQVAVMLDSYDFRTIEIAAMEAGEDALASSVVLWSCVLSGVLETLPGRELAYRLASDEQRIPIRYVLTVTPPANSPQFSNVRYLSNAALAIVKSLGPAWVAHMRSPGVLERMCAIFERLTGVMPELGEYGESVAAGTRGGKLALTQARPRRAKLVLSDGAPKAQGQPVPSSVVENPKLSSSLQTAFTGVDLGYRGVLEVVNLTNALLDLQADYGVRKLLSVVGASADFGALIVESSQVLLSKSAPRALAGLGILSGICDFIEFMNAGVDAAARQDYRQAVGHGVATAGAFTIATGSTLALAVTADAVLTVAATGATGAEAVTALAAAPAASGPMGIAATLGTVGAALVAGGSLYARLIASGPYEELAKFGFLGREHEAKEQDGWGWTSVELPNSDVKKEVIALDHLLCSFRVSIHDFHCTIHSGMYQADHVFEVVLERQYEGLPKLIALVEVSPARGEIVQRPGGNAPLGENSFVQENGDIILSDEFVGAPSNAIPGLPYRTLLMRRICVRLRRSRQSYVPPTLRDPKTKAPLPRQWVEAVVHSGVPTRTRRDAFSSDSTHRAAQDHLPGWR